MVAIQHLLCPTDFSKYSSVALDYAGSFARVYKARISLLHVVELFLPDPEYMAVYGDVDTLYDQFKDDAEKKINEIAASPQFEGIDVSCHVVVGKAFLEIVRFAQEHHADMIVMGTHGKSALNHILFGSTADKVVRKTPCPVLTVKHPEHEFQMP